MGLYMQGFFKTPAPPNTYHSQNASYYFSDFEESYQGDTILISARLRPLHKDATDRDLWLICFGGLRLDRFEVTRHGLRVDIIAKMRDLKEIREDIEEDRRIEMENKKIGEMFKRPDDKKVIFIKDISDIAKLFKLENKIGEMYWIIAEKDKNGQWEEFFSVNGREGEPDKMVDYYKGLDR